MPQFLNTVLARDTTDCTGANTGGLQVAGGAYVTKRFRVNGQALFNDNTASTSTTSGAVTIPNGGLGVGGAVYAASFNGSGSGLTSIPPAALLAGGSDGQLLAKNGTSWSWTSPLSNPMTTLGDLIMGGAAGEPTRRAGNTTTTPQFLKSLGSGGLATAPVWAQIAASDLSDGVSGTGNLAKVTGPTFTGGKVTLASTAAGYASLNIPAGTAPSSPANGDMWNVGGELFWGNGSQAQQLTDVITSTVGNGTLNLDGRLKSVVKIDLQGATTINMVNGGRDGQRLTLELTQDATGNRGVTIGTGFAWGADVTAFSPTTTPSKTDYIGLIYNSTAAAWRILAITKGY